MANWAKLQEDTIQLPVFKRAKHGIHFDKGNGEILANFCGKPAHYLDGGIWKQIDTKLLPLGDGFYGCPHSKVKVKPDGTVAVAGTDYVQRVELLSAQAGLLDGDKLVRKFSFGEQRMWVTEDGFRSEIQLNRIPTLTEARKLIATESGTLSKEYLKSLTTATDANGDIHTYSTLSAFRTWLASAAFPVVIDPDISVNTGVGGDNEIASGVPNNNMGIQAYLRLDTDGVRKVLIRFDLSSIASSSICTAGELKITSALAATSDTFYLYKITDANGNWVEGTKTNSTAASGESSWAYKLYNTTGWAGSAGLSTAGTDYVDTVIATVTGDFDADVQGSLVFNDSGLAVLQDWFGDATNNGFLLVNGSTNERKFHSGEATTASYRPILTVTYTAGGSITPIVQYYNRLRRN